MKARKKTCYLFLFEGFADYETSLATAGIRKSKNYQLKTIAFRMELITSMSGLSVMPDLDFRADVDLDDIDRDNTAMVILPSGAAWQLNLNDALTPLIDHCISLGIPVKSANGNGTAEFTQDIFETLGIIEESSVAQWFQYFQHQEA